MFRFKLLQGFFGRSAITREISGSGGGDADELSDSAVVRTAKCAAGFTSLWLGSLLLSNSCPPVGIGLLSATHL